MPRHPFRDTSAWDDRIGIAKVVLAVMIIFVFGFLAGRIDLPEESTRADVQPTAQRSMDSTMDSATQRLLERYTRLAARCEDLGVQGQRQPRP